MAGQWYHPHPRKRTGVPSGGTLQTLARCLNVPGGRGDLRAQSHAMLTLRERIGLGRRRANGPASYGPVTPLKSARDAESM